MDFKVIYEDNDVLVIDKPAGLISDDIPNRVHRLDKDTSGILLVAKNPTALEYLQKQFKERLVEKEYIALIVGHLKDEIGLGEEGKSSSSPFATARVITTLIGRSPNNRRKQKVYLPNQPDSQGKREAITSYKVLQRLENYDLIEAKPKTGRKHQIRAHFAYLNHPIAGDKLYGFKNQPCPEELTRQFLHASFLKIKMQNGEIKEFRSHLPNDLKKVIEKLP